MKKEKVNHPSHYNTLKESVGIEVIDIIRDMDFCKGNAIKYIMRSGNKTEEGMTLHQKEVEDLKKAIWYLNDRIESLKKKYPDEFTIKTSRKHTNFSRVMN